MMILPRTIAFRSEASTVATDIAYIPTTRSHGPAPPQGTETSGFVTITSPDTVRASDNAGHMKPTGDDHFRAGFFRNLLCTTNRRARTGTAASTNPSAKFPITFAPPIRASKETNAEWRARYNAMRARHAAQRAAYELEIDALKWKAIEAYVERELVRFEKVGQEYEAWAEEYGRRYDGAWIAEMEEERVREVREEEEEGWIRRAEREVEVEIVCRAEADEYGYWFDLMWITEMEEAERQEEEDQRRGEEERRVVTARRQRLEELIEGVGLSDSSEEDGSSDEDLSDDELR